MVAEAVTASVEEFCATQGQAVVGRPPASSPASAAITTPSRGIRPATLSRHKRVHSAKRSRPRHAHALDRAEVYLQGWK